MTEKESAHPTSQQLKDLTSTTNGDLVTPLSPTSLDAPTLIATGMYRKLNTILFSIMI